MSLAPGETLPSVGQQPVSAAAAAFASGPMPTPTHPLPSNTTPLRSHGLTMTVRPATSARGDDAPPAMLKPLQTPRGAPHSSAPGSPLGAGGQPRRDALGLPAHEFSPTNSAFASVGDADADGLAGHLPPAAAVATGVALAAPGRGVRIVFRAEDTDSAAAASAAAAQSPAKPTLRLVIKPKPRPGAAAADDTAGDALPPSAATLEAFAAGPAPLPAGTVASPPMQESTSSSAPGDGGSLMRIYVYSSFLPSAAAPVPVPNGGAVSVAHVTHVPAGLPWLKAKALLAPPELAAIARSLEAQPAGIRRLSRTLSASASAAALRGEPAAPDSPEPAARGSAPAPLGDVLQLMHLWDAITGEELTSSAQLTHRQRLVVTLADQQPDCISPEAFPAALPPGAHAPLHPALAAAAAAHAAQQQAQQQQAQQQAQQQRNQLRARQRTGSVAGTSIADVVLSSSMPSSSIASASKTRAANNNTPGPQHPPAPAKEAATSGYGARISLVFASGGPSKDADGDSVRGGDDKRSQTVRANRGTMQAGALNNLFGGDKDAAGGKDKKKDGDATPAKELRPAKKKLGSSASTASLDEGAAGGKEEAKEPKEPKEGAKKERRGTGAAWNNNGSSRTAMAHARTGSMSNLVSMLLSNKIAASAAKDGSKDGDKDKEPKEPKEKKEAAPEQSAYLDAMQTLSQEAASVLTCTMPADPVAVEDVEAILASQPHVPSNALVIMQVYSSKQQGLRGREPTATTTSHMQHKPAQGTTLPHNPPLFHLVFPLSQSWESVMTACYARAANAHTSVAMGNTESLAHAAAGGDRAKSSNVAAALSLAKSRFTARRGSGAPATDAAAAESGALLLRNPHSGARVLSVKDLIANAVVVRADGELLKPISKLRTTESQADMNGATAAAPEEEDEDEDDDEMDEDEEKLRAAVSAKLVRPVEAAILPPFSSGNVLLMDSVLETLGATEADRKLYKAAHDGHDGVPAAALTVSGLASRPRLVVDVVLSAAPRDEMMPTADHITKAEANALLHECDSCGCYFSEDAKARPVRLVRPRKRRGSRPALMSSRPASPVAGASAAPAPATLSGEAAFELGPDPPAHATPETANLCWRHSMPPVWVPAGVDMDYTARALAGNKGNANAALLAGTASHTRRNTGLLGHSRATSMDMAVVSMARNLVIAAQAGENSQQPSPLVSPKAIGAPTSLPAPAGMSSPVPGTMTTAPDGEAPASYFLAHPCCGAPPAELLQEAISRERVRRRALRTARRAVVAARQAAKDQADAQAQAQQRAANMSLPEDSPAPKERSFGDEEDEDEDEDKDEAAEEAENSDDLGNSDDEDVRTDDEAMAPFVSSLGPCTPFSHSGPVVHPPRMRGMSPEEVVQAAEADLAKRRKKEADRERRARAPKGPERALHFFDSHDPKSAGGPNRIDAQGARNTPWFTVKYSVREKRNWMWLWGKFQSGFRKNNRVGKRKATNLELRHALTQRVIDCFEDIEDLALRDGSVDIVVYDVGAPVINKFKDQLIQGFDRPRQIAASSPWWTPEELGNVVRQCCVCNTMFQSASNTREANHERGHVCIQHRARPVQGMYMPLLWDTEVATRHYKRFETARQAREAIERAKALDSIKKALNEAQAKAQKLAQEDENQRKADEASERKERLLQRLRDEGLVAEDATVESIEGSHFHKLLPGIRPVWTPAQAIEAMALAHSGMPWRVLRVWDSGIGGPLTRGKGAAPLFTLRVLALPRMSLELILARVAQAMLHLTAQAQGKLADSSAPLALNAPAGPTLKSPATLDDVRVARMPPLAPGLAWPLRGLPDAWVKAAQAALGGMECPAPITGAEAAVAAAAAAATAGGGARPGLGRRASMTTIMDVANAVMASSSSMPSLVNVQAQPLPASASQAPSTSVAAGSKTIAVEQAGLRNTIAQCVASPQYAASLVQTSELELRHPVTGEVFIAFSKAEARVSRAFAIAAEFENTSNNKNRVRTANVFARSRRGSMTSHDLAAAAAAATAAAAGAGAEDEFGDDIKEASQRGGLAYSRAVMSVIPPPKGTPTNPAPPPPPTFSRGLILADYADASGYIDVVVVRSPSSQVGIPASPPPAAGSCAAHLTLPINTGTRPSLRPHAHRAELQLATRRCNACGKSYCTRELALSPCQYHPSRAVPISLGAGEGSLAKEGGVNTHQDFAFPCCGTLVPDRSVFLGEVPEASLDRAGAPMSHSAVLAKLKQHSADKAAAAGALPAAGTAAGTPMLSRRGSIVGSRRGSLTGGLSMMMSPPGQPQQQAQEPGFLGPQPCITKMHSGSIARPLKFSAM